MHTLVHCVENKLDFCVKVNKNTIAQWRGICGAGISSSTLSIDRAGERSSAGRQQEDLYVMMSFTSNQQILQIINLCVCLLT